MQRAGKIVTWNSAAVLGRWRARRAGIIVSGCPPSVPALTIAATQLSATTIRLDFNFPVVNNEALRNAANYVITPTLTVNLVEVLSATQVRLTMDEQKTGQTYSVEVKTVEAA